MKDFKRNEVLSWISDLYKDVHGVRPRYINFKEWSDGELEVYTDKLIVQLKEMKNQSVFKKKPMLKDFKIKFKKTIRDLELVIENSSKWLFSSEEYDQGEYSYRLGY